MADHAELDAVINVRVSSFEKEGLREASSDAGLSLSAYCRRRFLGHKVVAHTDRADIRELLRLGDLLKRVHTESGGAYSAETGEALADIRRRFFGHKVVAHNIRELRRLGDQLKRVHKESGGAYSAETGQALADIRRCIERLAA